MEIPIEGIKDSIFFFVRFGERIHLESLRQGNLFLHNASFYNALEEEKNMKGQGDRNDGKFKFISPRIEVRDPETNVLLIPSLSGPVTLSIGKHPIFCLYSIGIENIISYKIDEQNKKLLISCSFSKEQREYIKTSYPNADAAMLIPNPRSLIEQIKSYAISHGMAVKAMKVKYSDFSINDWERIKSCTEDYTNIYFWKDIYFKFEQEYRFLFSSEVDDYVIYQIGEIKDAIIFDIDTFLNLRIDLDFNIQDINDSLKRGEYNVII